MTSSECKHSDEGRIAGNLRARQGKLRSIQKALREKAF